MNTELQIHIVRDQMATGARAARMAAARPAAARRAGRDSRSACIRLAGERDRPALQRLAELEGRTPPAGDALVAEVEDRVLAAIPVAGGEPLADPFEHTADLTAALHGARTHFLGENPRQGRSRRGLRAVRQRLGSGGGAAPRAAGAPAVPGSERMLIR